MLKHFLRDDDSLSSFLKRNASFPEDAVQQVMEAHVNLEQVSRLAALDSTDVPDLDNLHQSCPLRLRSSSEASAFT